MTEFFNRSSDLNKPPQTSSFRSGRSLEILEDKIDEGLEKIKQHLVKMGFMGPEDIFLGNFAQGEDYEGDVSALKIKEQLEKSGNYEKVVLVPGISTDRRVLDSSWGVAATPKKT